MLRYSFNRRLFVFVWSVALALLLPFGSAAQNQQAFSVDDLLNVVNVAVTDVSDDGRWVAVTTATLRDRIGIDNSRFGDPTYIAPSNAEVMVIDTQTGTSQKLFTEKRQVRQLKWSPDGSRLAMLALKGDLFEPTIWERATNKWQTVNLPPAKSAAENSELTWTPAGDQLLIALRPDEWRKQARDRFLAETKATVVVHSTKEPFLAWEDLRRMAAVRSLAAYDLKSGETRELIAQTKLNAYDLSEDGALLTYQEDITKKTDYDVIFGSENQVQAKPTIGGEARTLLKSTKGITLIWSRDGRHYTYAKDGNLFMASVDDKEARQITGNSTATGKERVADNAEKKNEKERFSAVRLSAKGDWLIASNKEGLWLVDAASGAKENFLKMSEEDKEAPRYQVIEWNGDDIYLTYTSRTKWERGLVKYNRASKQMTDLVKDARIYANFKLSKDGKTFVFSAAWAKKSPGSVTPTAATACRLRLSKR